MTPKNSQNSLIDELKGAHLEADKKNLECENGHLRHKAKLMENKKKWRTICLKICTMKYKLFNHALMP